MSEGTQPDFCPHEQAELSSAPSRAGLGSDGLMPSGWLCSGCLMAPALITSILCILVALFALGVAKGGFAHQAWQRAGV
jgi:hypothetical protein